MKLMSSTIALALVLMASAPSFGQQRARQVTFGNLIAALNNINVQLENIHVLEDIEIGDITVVDARNLLRGSNINALNNVLRNANIEIDVLRNALQNFDILRDANIVITDVIAIDVLSGGDVRLFILQN
jgi:hypothetical protein